MRIPSAIVVLSALGFASPLAAQDASFNLELDQLQTSSGGAVPTSGLVLLVVETGSGGFDPVQAGGLGTGSGIVLSQNVTLDGSGGSDLVVWRGDLSTFATPGVLDSAISNVPLSGALQAGDKLAVVWFPSLSLSSTSVSSGASYGEFSATSNLSGGSAWVVPSGGSLVDLYGFTTNSSLFPNGDQSGTLPPSALQAQFETSAVPEPASWSLIAGLVSLGWAACRRRRVPG